MKDSIVVPRAMSVPRLVKSEEDFDTFVMDANLQEDHMIQVSEFDMIMKKLKEEK